MIHTVKGFIIVNEADVDVFLEFSCFLCNLTDVGNLISGSSAFSKSNLYIWKFSVHILLKPSLKDFEHYLASMWNEHSHMVVWAFFGIAFLWDWDENWPFPVLWPLLSFPDYLQIGHKCKILRFVIKRFTGNINTVKMKCPGILADRVPEKISALMSVSCVFKDTWFSAGC